MASIAPVSFTVVIPCIRGLRVTVSAILGLLATGNTRGEILAAYPYLEAEDIDQCLAYAGL
ncbi:DUF433 domain-containing protein [Aeoliella mucimassa]|uniref:DUF433 domain-containing protein n=1 Tax=Aeoliella mucimassa TaxID=2527972 RepID=A0A518AM09_9BACT|nr:hypothetical protein Pan181_19410 [Aeoliella mucimassa]